MHTFNESEGYFQLEMTPGQAWPTFVPLRPGSIVRVKNLTNDAIVAGYILINQIRATPSPRDRNKSKTLRAHITLNDKTEITLNGSEDTVQRILVGILKSQDSVWIRLQR